VPARTQAADRITVSRPPAPGGPFARGAPAPVSGTDRASALRTSAECFLRIDNRLRVVGRILQVVRSTPRQWPTSPRK